MRTSSRGGVTLIELLITMTIIVIISGLILGTASSAIENAREKNTQALVTKIATLINERLASYATRRVDFNDQVSEAIASFTDPKLRGKALADMRLLGYREMMKMEMPDRWSDVANDPVVLKQRPGPSAAYEAILLGRRPSTDNQGAECLYLTVMRHTGDGEAPSLFNATQIGDTDGDGAKEFIDGWGNPISWIRWPTGYAPSPIMSGNSVSDHEEADVYLRDVERTQRQASQHFPVPQGGKSYPAAVTTTLNTMAARDGGAFRIIPLIYSCGPDGLQSFTSKANDVGSDLDPYSSVESGQTGDDAGRLPGTPYPDRPRDDITNHLNEY